MIKINGEPAETYDIWSVKFNLVDGKEIEVVYPDGEKSARQALDYMPGSLWKRRAYSTATRNPAHVEDPVEVSLEVPGAARLN